MLINRKNAIIYFYNREVLPVLSTLILFPFDTTTEVNKKTMLEPSTFSQEFKQFEFIVEDKL